MTRQDINAAANLAQLAEWNGNDNVVGMRPATETPAPFWTVFKAMDYRGVVRHGFVGD